MTGNIKQENTKKLRQIRDKYVPDCLAHVTPIIAGKTKGSRIEDVDGNEYLDFGAGISVVNAGNCHPDVVEAVKKQAEISFHTCFHIIMQETYIKLAEKLVKMLPGDHAKKVMFLNSGAEAVENIIKLARIYTRRRGFLAPQYGFHGRTYGALALTSKTKPLKAGLEPFMPEVFRIPYAYCYRCPLHSEYPSCEMGCVKMIEEMFTTTVAAESVAGLIVEPVLGEGGVVIPPKEYIQGLRQICDKHGILLIFDEIQTAFGRMGYMFGSEYFDVLPDLTSFAKALGNGLPISAVAGKAEIMDKPDPGALGSTYGGNPIACAGALAMLDVLQREKLPQRSKETGAVMLKRFKLLEERYTFVGDVRGIGMMLGIELVNNKSTKEPDKDKATDVIKGCYNNGLIVVRAGAYGNIVRILPPLNTNDDDIETGLKIVEKVFESVK